MTLTLQSCLNEGGMSCIMTICWSNNVWKQSIFLGAIYWDLQMVSAEVILWEVLCKFAWMLLRKLEFREPRMVI